MKSDTINLLTRRLRETNRTRFLLMTLDSYLFFSVVDIKDLDEMLLQRFPKDPEMPDHTFNPYYYPMIAEMNIRGI